MIAKRCWRRCATTSRPSSRSSLDRIQAETRFREDLDADSLDLYELVMELEDTYGVSMTEEEAAKIETVGDAVDFVIERLPA